MRTFQYLLALLALVLVLLQAHVLVLVPPLNLLLERIGVLGLAILM
jgi:hypothetical protein